MTVKYHISKTTQRPNICRAQSPESCPLKSDDGTPPPHFDSKEDARAYVEKSNSEKYDDVPASSRSRKAPSSSELPEDYVNPFETSETGKMNHGESTTVPTERKSTIVNGVDYGDFEPYTAEPKNFDDEFVKYSEKVADAKESVRRAERTLVYNSLPPGARIREKDYPEKLQEALRKSETDERLSSDRKRLEDMKKKYIEARKAVRTLDEVYHERGSWNRAFLTHGEDGHVHKTNTDCPTLNRGGNVTSMSLMTDYSDKSENEIVKDAGYRACTKCYPSAPIGDERTLPTKMFTEEEKKRNIERAEQRKKLEAKKSAAASKAPTASGKPLIIADTIGSKTYNQELKTESSAVRYYTDTLFSQTGYKVQSPHLYETEDEKMKEEKANRQKIIDALAEKHGVSSDKMKEELNKKVKAKVDKENKLWVKKGRQEELDNAKRYHYSPPEWVNRDEIYIFEED